MPALAANVPFLPGHVMNDLTAQNHRRPQTLVYKLEGQSDALKSKKVSQDAAMRILESAQTPRGSETPGRTPRSARNTYRPAIEPAWLKHDRQVLRFYAYFQEPVAERPDENARVRNVVLNYYLEDGTMQLTEPKVENSGIWPQGPLVRRHRIPKPDGQNFEPKDLKLGSSIPVYGRTFRIIQCDEFTRWFYGESDMDIGTPEEAPMDRFFETQVWKHENAQHKVGFPADVMYSKEYTELKLGGSRKNARLRQFMENDRKVLRFYAYWDDPTRYGTRQYFTVHYYLADGTVEILNMYDRNSGRDPYPVFYARAPLNKQNVLTHTPAMLVAKDEPVTPQDILVGQTFPVYGREFFVYDADSCTKKFYLEFLGLDLDAVAIPEDKKTHVTLRQPPHTAGFGSEEDSLASCLSLVAKPPRKDLTKLMTNSQRVLRYECRPINGLPEDEHRRFILGYFLADDTIAVWELRQRNSGQVEGKFSERSVKYNISTGKQFESQEFFVGAKVAISAMPFKIVRADEFTLKYMEKHPEIWPMHSIQQLSRKLQALDYSGLTGTDIDCEVLRANVKAQLQVELTDAELVTLLRYCCGDVATSVSTPRLQEVLADPPEPGHLVDAKDE